MNTFSSPKLLNIEVTTRCHYSCKQCYCKNEGDKDLDLMTAKHILSEVNQLGIEYVNISGGETLLYPYLFELISFCSEMSIKPNIAISGYQFDSKKLKVLIQSGIYKIFVSLNGSTESINALSRQGYHEAMNALSILKKSSFHEYAINFVVSKENVYDLPQVICLAEEMKVKELYVLIRKPDKADRLQEILNKKDLEFICSFYKNYHGSVKIIFDVCFVQFTMLYYTNLLAIDSNFQQIGCPAGRFIAAINVNGEFFPCRHIHFSEKYNSFKEYWDNSPLLKKIREFKPNNEICQACIFLRYCKPCYAALTLNTNQKFAVENYCPMQKI